MGSKEKNTYLYVVFTLGFFLFAVAAYFILGWFRIYVENDFVPLFFAYPLLPIYFSFVFYIPSFVIAKRFGLYWGFSIFLIGLSIYTFEGYYYAQRAIESYGNTVFLMLAILLLLGIFGIIALALSTKLIKKKPSEKIKKAASPQLDLGSSDEIPKVEITNMPAIPQPIEVVIRNYEAITGNSRENEEKIEQLPVNEESFGSETDFAEEISNFIKNDEEGWEENEALASSEELIEEDYSTKRDFEESNSNVEVFEGEHEVSPEKNQVLAGEEAEKLSVINHESNKGFEIIDDFPVNGEQNKLSDYDLITSKNKSELFSKLTNRLVKEVHSAQAVFALDYDSQQNELVINEIYGLDRDLKGKTVASGFMGFEGKAIKDMEPKIVYSLEKLSLSEEESSLLYYKEKEIGLRSLLIIPLIYQSKVRAVFSLGNFDDPRAFAEDDVETVKKILDLSHFSFDNIDQIEKTNRSKFESDQIIDEAIEIGSIVELESMLKTLLSKVIHIVDADNGSIMLVDEPNKELIVRSTEGLDNGILIKTRVPLGEGIAGWVAKHQKPLLIDDLNNSEELSQNGQAQVYSAISVPLITGNNLVGVLNIGSTRKNHKFNQEDLSKANLLTLLAARSIENTRLIKELESLYLDTIKALTKAIETKDPYSQGHSENVVKYALAIAQELDLDQNEIKAIETAGWLHDIGMIGMRDNFNKKIGPLNVVEKTILKKHPQIAKDLLEKVSILRNVIPIIYHHHEHYDGRGYIDGLTGDDIPVGARILAVADAFDALTSDRAYRKAYSIEEALSELDKSAGTQFDPKIINIFKNLVKSKIETEKTNVNVE